MSYILRLPLLLALVASLVRAQEAPPAPNPGRAVPMFDGKTLDGWEGTPGFWRVTNGVIIGGSLTETVKQNEFLATTRRYTNFIFRTKFKLTGTGFVNSGVQMRSERVPNSSEMAGYQCDLGEPNWWGSLYDESRRNVTLAWSDMAVIGPRVRRNNWNDYVIRAEGNRITTWINGAQGVDYFEPDGTIIGSGKIGFQVHGGGATEAAFKDITIEELPVKPKLRGAGEPPAPPHESPLSPEEQQATFSVPPGFKVELVAAEPDGGKFVALNFDHAGRMWTMTALEYPLDANEAGAEAKALFDRGGRDKVLVFDTPTAPGRQTARTFADGLVMPLGVLPYKNGAYVQYGREIRFYYDSNGDGKADGYTNVLTGFGIEDSHLFPHQFTRAPGGWMWLAQGAFNYSKVATPAHQVTEFNKTKLARWRPDGSRFETIGWGPCNIWGLVLDRHGEAFIQEANDQGWPLMPFLEGGSYPLCGDDVPKPYAPPFPKTGEREMGGTGLSGLALSEGGDSFGGPWRDVFFVNNPITRKVQALRVHRGGTSESSGDFGNGWKLEHLPDFVLSSDPWFRPVAMAFGPDGCLYVVDWYNKIISHNEVPRAHPERDKTRGRVWRIRQESQPMRAQLPNLYKSSEAELLTHLGATNTWEVNAAWQEIVDRPAKSLATPLAKLMLDDAQPNDLRIRALWCLEALHKVELAQIGKLASSKHRSVRKEALRAARESLRSENPLPLKELLGLGKQYLGDRDRLVRHEAIRLLGDLLDFSAKLPPESQSYLIAQVMRGYIRIPDAAVGKWPTFFHAFEQYLVRLALETHPALVRDWFAANLDTSVDLSDRHALGGLVLGGTEGARRLAVALPKMARGPSAEELSLLASFPDEPLARKALLSALTNAANLRALYERRGQITNQATLAPLLTDAIRALLARDPSEVNQSLLVQLATGFKLSSLESELVTAATRTNAPAEAQIAALRALRESGSTNLDVLRRFAASGHETVRREAVVALAAAKSDAVVPAFLELWPSLPPTLRKTAVDRLASSAASAKQLVAALANGIIARDELDRYTLDKLGAVLPNDLMVKKLISEVGGLMRPVLRLNGGDGDYVDSELTLDGPFTVECWTRLDPGINNEDSLLGGPGFDLNFYDSRFRVFVGGTANDIAVATKPMTPEAWTHLAVTRDGAGVFRIFLNGELDVTSIAKEPRTFEKLVPFRSNPAGGTAGEFAEFRVWKTCRSADQIRSSANLAMEQATATRSALVFHGSEQTWGKLHGGAKIEPTLDFPPLVNQAEAAMLDTKFAGFRVLGTKAGDPASGQQVFTTTCAVCHTVKGAGGKIGPALDGAGAHGLEGLLRNVITPNAAMEAGYRRFRVETKDGDVIEGLLAGQDADSVTVRQPNTEDQRFLRANLKRAGFQRTSIMPEGLLEALQPAQVTDLLTYVLTLK